jgi:dipeptidyl aminopeptidase/acylaminoacyl peptidase
MDFPLMNLRPQFAIFLAICTFTAFAAQNSTLLHAQEEEKRALDHSDYDRWNTIGQQSLSNDGTWALYTVRPGKGDAVLHIREVKTAKQFTIQRGSGARFTHDSRYVICTIPPDPEVIKKLKREKTKPEDMPKTQLQIIELKSGQAYTIDNVKSFALPEKNGDHFAYLLGEAIGDQKLKSTKGVNQVYENLAVGLVKVKPQTKQSKKKEPAEEKSQQEKAEKVPSEKTPPEKGSEQTEQKQQETKPKTKTEPEEKKQSPEKTDEKKDDEKKKPNGTVLVIRDLATHIERRIPDVVSYIFDENGTRLVFATSAEQPERDGVHVYEFESQTQTELINGLGNYRSLTFDKSGSLIAFLTDRDDYKAKQPSWSLYLVNKNAKQATKVVDAETDGIPDGWWVASSAAPAFSEDQRRLYFNTRPKPDDLGKEKTKEQLEKEKEEPKAKLDIWHWQDPQLQPQQLLQANSERNRSYRAVFDLRDQNVVQLASEQLENVMADPRSKSDVAIGLDRNKYEILASWDTPGFQDVYLVDLNTGKQKLVLEKLRGNAMLSPEGKYLVWWEAEQQKGYGVETAEALNSDSFKPTEITNGIDVPLVDELHDTPSLPGPYGFAGWTEDESAVLMYDRYDIWKLDPSGKSKPENVTRGYGRKNLITFRYVRLDREERTIALDKPLLLSLTDQKTKATGYCTIEAPDNSAGSETEFEPNVLIKLNEELGRLTKSDNADRIMFTRETFRVSPDLWVSDTDFQTLYRISKINPQQSEYLWGSAELTQWKSATGETLDGIIYKPDNFDPNKKYPMMVYFYERNSDNLNRYYAPAAGRSIINFSFYVSRGYVVFVPDIPYRTGLPGQSCYDAVVPGVKHMIDQGYIDEKAVGVQGHSWGGYQIAYLVTKTDIFACAEAGAPVSNMTSAYGGIRWGSGMSRMFQYERTQSRIGQTLWEARDKYLENSPVFFADKINTPLLILHNDQDTAVPWYQGIEMFVAMRRLGKPAWMLNYNDEPHWVMKEENRLDFAIRLQQFFDHYCKGAPAPKWLSEGVPAVDKGKKFGLELEESKEGGK